MTAEIPSHPTLTGRRYSIPSRTLAQHLLGITLARTPENSGKFPQKSPNRLSFLNTSPIINI
jgi:hypothetical protein